MQIYSYRKDKLTGNHTAAINTFNNLFTAFTYTESKSFKTLEAAQKWMAKRGFINILEIEEIN